MYLGTKSSINRHTKMSQTDSGKLLKMVKMCGNNITKVRRQITKAKL